jgi:hypothetical protein
MGHGGRVRSAVDLRLRHCERLRQFFFTRGLDALEFLIELEPGAVQAAVDAHYAVIRTEAFAGKIVTVFDENACLDGGQLIDHMPIGGVAGLI